MAINEEQQYVTYSCDGVTTEFPVTFSYLKDEYLSVSHYDDTTGYTEDLDLGVDYTIVSDEIVTTVTYPTNDKIYIQLDVPASQETTLLENGQISSELLNFIHDKLTLLSGQLNTATLSSVRLAVPEASAVMTISGVRENKLLMFDEDGDVSLIDMEGFRGDPGYVTNWLGSLATAPVSPNTNDAYYDTVLKRSLIWDGDSWEIVAIDGVGVPTGGTTGQVLTKDSATDNDTSWQTPANPDPFIVGDILMHDGTWVDNVTRVGWYACIAANSGQGCPDLENQFIKGSAAADVGTTGGSNTHTLAKSEIPKHYHEIDHDHGAASTGAHTHPQRGMVTGIGSLTKISVDFTATGEASYHATASTTPSINLPNWTGNSEDGTETGLNGEAHNNEPQYYKLIFIRKCS